MAATTLNIDSTYRKWRYCHCLKKLCQLIFCSVLVKYESISIKIGRHVLEDTTNKTMQKVPTSPIMCASTTLRNLRWLIELSTQYLHVHFNESLNSYKTTGSYHHHHHLIFTHQTKQQYQNRLCIVTMCEWIKRPRSGTNNFTISRHLRWT